ncbi:MAG: protein-S-isoprenylcysteine O-methyltransferase [Candidatus Brocadiia bacterium]|jgi:protein-S-isoprenylcysteine O-methyltransferase Ste14|nr:protein-S-isoprenylcysteine O-methyltransferase [Candidatus Brocadiia bacterium]
MFDNVFEAFYAVGFIGGSVIRAIYTRHHRQSRAADDRKTALDMALITFAAVGLLIAPLAYLLTPWLDFANYRLPTWAGWLGVAVFAAALWLLWRSHIDLGRNWSPTLQIREEHSLVTRGVFRHIRHPMYAAHCLWGIAQVLLLQNWIAGPALLVCCLPGYLHRVPEEEQMMLEHFGEEYRLYMDRTGRMIPRLRR